MKMFSQVLFSLVFCVSIIPATAAAQEISVMSAELNPQKVALQGIISGLINPIFVTNAGDGSGRLFIVERRGVIRIFSNSALLVTPFLDITSIVNSTGGEQGLLALAFHPDYLINGKFYTVHTDLNGSIVLSSFLRSVADPDLADPASGITLVTVPKTAANHNGGTLAFGQDGFLYWSTGDGGGGGDPNNNAQDLTVLLGKILRLNVNSGPPYGIPADNPFFSDPNPAVREEIWAYGLRNPWRFSFDRLTGDMYIGDVGQNAWEEIDFQPAASAGGENYGWRCYEGNHAFNIIGCLPQSSYVAPVAEYPHTVVTPNDNGCSVTGGYVYRGASYPEMQGYYFYSDFCTGKIYSLINDPINGWTSSLVMDTGFFVSTFGEDEQGELYLTDYSNGIIYQLITSNTDPTLGTLTPSALSSAVGAARSFSAVYSDAEGYTDLRYVYLLVNTSISGANAIFLLYDRSTNRLYLMNDSNTAFLGRCTPGVAGTVTNTQGTLDCGATTVSGLGNDLTVNWNITPKAGIIGTKNLFLYAADITNASSGWIDKGDWTIIALTLGTLTPSTVVGPPNVAQNFKAVYSDANGFTNLSTARLLINSSLTSVNGIYVYYDRNANKLRMYNDSGTAAGNCTPSAAGTLTNTQGTLNCQATTVTGAGNDLTVNWNITPSPTFTGTRNLYMYATDITGARAGWTDKGDWTITSSNVAPTLGTLTPSVVSGAVNAAQSFSVVYSDANGYGNLSTARLLINSSLTSVNGIYVYYDRNANRLRMYNDSGTAAGSCTPSVAGTLTNTQGTLDCGATTVTPLGNNLTVNWNITPSPTFTGTRNLYMYATDNFAARVGWVDKGDWTISP